MWETVEKINSKELVPLAKHFIRFLNRQKDQIFPERLSLSLKWHKYPHQKITNENRMELSFPNKFPPYNAVQIHQCIQIIVWRKFQTGKQLLFKKYLVSPLENFKNLPDLIRATSFKSEVSLLKCLQEFGRRESITSMPRLIKGKLWRH